MNRYLEELKASDLEDVREAWRVWMWDMGAPPSEEVCEEALRILEARKTDSNLAADFIAEIEEFIHRAS